MCSKIRAPSNYEKNAVLLNFISNIVWLELWIRLKAYKAKKLHNMKGPSMHFNRWRDKTEKSYDSRMNANVKENVIPMCSKIRAPLYYGKILYFSLPYQIFSD